MTWRIPKLDSLHINVGGAIVMTKNRYGSAIKNNPECRIVRKIKKILYCTGTVPYRYILPGSARFCPVRVWFELDSGQTIAMERRFF